MFAYYVHHIDPFIIKFNEQFGIRWYGMAYLCGFLAGGFLLYWLARKEYGPLKEKQVWDYVTFAAIFGVLLGGRLGYVIFYQPAMFLNPLSIFKVWDGGMSSHGGILGMLIATWIYGKRHHLPIAGLSDNVVAVAPLGLMFGRIANFINGELYGRAAHVSWAMQFPTEILEHPDKAVQAVAACSSVNPQWNSPDVIVAASKSNAQVREILSHILTPRYPSQLFEAALEGLFLLICLLAVRLRFRTPNGITAGSFFILYPLVRIVCEYFREPDVGIEMTGSFTRGQFLSIFMVLIGMIFFWHAKNSAKSIQGNNPKKKR